LGIAPEIGGEHSCFFSRTFRGESAFFNEHLYQCFLVRLIDETAARFAWDTIGGADGVAACSCYQA
jgi:hypothetical protein